MVNELLKDLKLEQINPTKVHATIIFDAKEFDKASTSVYNMYKNLVDIPGFRKGRIPKNIAIMKLGKDWREMLYTESANMLMKTAYPQILEENDLHPIMESQASPTQMKSGMDLILESDIILRPKFEVKQYKGIEVKKNNTVVTDSQIDDRLKRESETNAITIPVEDRKSQVGDIVGVTYALADKSNGEIIDGSPNFDIIVGQEIFFPELEKAIIDRNIGETIVIDLTFNEEYQIPSFRGKTAILSMKINTIRAKIVPTIDDEFAKDVSEFDTIEEYKASIRTQMEKTNIENDRKTMVETILTTIVNDTDIGLPEELVAKHTNLLLKTFANILNKQGITIEQFLTNINKTEEQFILEYRSKATDEIKRELITFEIGRLENISITQEDVDAHIIKVAEESRMTVEALKNQLNPQIIQNIKDELGILAVQNVLFDGAIFIE